MTTRLLTLTRPTISSVGALLMVLALLGTACEEDDVKDTDNDPDTEQPDGDGSDDNNDSTDPGTTVDYVEPSVLSSRLMLPGATAMAGTLQPAVDAGYKIDVADTIFVMKDFHFGDRIQILPDTTGLSALDTVITGVYVQIEGAQEYYDVPGGLNASAWIDETGKPYTTFNFSLDIDLDDLGLGFPFSTEIIIQPHDESGTAMDSFEKTLTVEDPKNESGAGCNDIRRERGPGIISEEVYNTWKWESDIYIRGEEKEIFNAPQWKRDLDILLGGCCNPDDSLTTWPASDPRCFTEADNWVEIENSDAWYVPTFAQLSLFYDGTIHGGGEEHANRFIPDSTNLCKNYIHYEYKVYSNGGGGTHNFSPGATSLTINSDYSGFSKPFQNSQIVYTCHKLTMIVPNGGDGKIARVYNQLGDTDTRGIDWTWFD